MRINKIISYTLFLFVMAIFFSSQIYAPWTENNLPVEPDRNNTYLTCPEWIKFNRFELENYPYNRDEAVSRDPKFDRIASKWAAIYAFKIGGIDDIYQISPEDFCKTFEEDYDVPKRYKALEDEYTDCEGWINLYGFYEDHDENYTYALNIDISKVKYMSIWAYTYWLFLWKNNGKYELTPLAFCSKMGMEKRWSYPFWSDYGTLKTCYEWLEVHNFNYVPDHNLLKAATLTAEIKQYPLSIHYFANTYASQLMVWSMLAESVQYNTPHEFCSKFDGNGVDPMKYDFHYAGPPRRPRRSRQ